MRAQDDGSLIGSGPWRLEAATGETRLHHSLSRTAGAGDGAIARLASTQGMLRHRASAYVHGGSEGYWADQVMRFAQSRLPETDEVWAWTRGERSSVPPGSEEIAGWAEYLATTLPEPAIRYLRASFSGEAPDEALEELGAALEPLALPVRVVPPSVTGKASTERTAMVGDLMEQLARDMATRRSPEGEPELASFAEAITSLLVVSPEFLARMTSDPRALATVGETCDEWRAVGADLGRWAHLVSGLRRARLGGLTLADRKALLEALQRLLSWEPPPRQSPAELADLALPVVILRVEEALYAHGAWPPTQSMPLPTYTRALVSLWREAAESAPPRSCLTVGCSSAISAPSKARYCQTCARKRKAEQVARRRRPPARTPRSQSGS